MPPGTGIPPLRMHWDCPLDRNGDQPLASRAGRAGQPGRPGRPGRPGTRKWKAPRQQSTQKPRALASWSARCLWIVSLRPSQCHKSLARQELHAAPARGDLRHRVLWVPWGLSGPWVIARAMPVRNAETVEAITMGHGEVCSSSEQGRSQAQETHGAR